MSKAMEDAIETYMRKHEASSHVTALLVQALALDLRGIDIGPAVRREMPEPNHGHIACFVYILDDIMRECRLDRAHFIRALTELNAESCKEVLRCAQRPEPDDSPISSSQSPVSASAMPRDDSSQVTEFSSEQSKWRTHTGVSTSDSTGS